MDRPDTRYTWSGDFSIAYQVVGSGPVDLVYLPQFLSNVEWNWQMAEHARFMTRLASFSRLIVIDPRGVGCSDQPPPGEAATLEDKVDDVLAVMGPRRRSRPRCSEAGDPRSSRCSQRRRTPIGSTA